MPLSKRHDLRAIIERLEKELETFPRQFVARDNLHTLRVQNALDESYDALTRARKQISQEFKLL